MARRAGQMHGLQIVLQVEKFEQVENFLDGSGVRLVIHEPGTLPFPEEEGFTLSPGYETSIGMKMVHLTRTHPPHGRCDDGKKFYQTYGVPYRMSTCLHMCRNIKVVDICKCRPSENIVDIPYMDKFSSLPVCSLAEKSIYDETAFHMEACEHYVYYQIEENSIKCDCESACRETVYRSTLSGRVWPKESYLREELLTLACSGSNFSYCPYQPMAAIQMDYFNDNFLKMVIYFEDLNFEEISEEPLYDGYRFLSDIGGALGLFLGASILSFVELVQLMVEILNHFRHIIIKYLKNKSAGKKKKTLITVKPVQRSKVKNRVFTVSKIQSEVV
ncbi:degenerin unc-8 [Magallana gigas]|uniref:degenerin unc-8 n=1 Tax=Magallana gigas TaxID=29159 RepID=UPI00333F67FD